MRVGSRRLSDRFIQDELSYSFLKIIAVGRVSQGNSRYLFERLGWSGIG
jgi:hypothetical protein